MFMKPGTYKNQKEKISKLSDEDMQQDYRNRILRNYGHVRFVVDADPVYLIFYSFNGEQGALDKEMIGMFPIYREGKDKFKIANFPPGNDDIKRLFYKTDFFKRIFNPRVTLAKTARK